MVFSIGQNDQSIQQMNLDHQQSSQTGPASANNIEQFHYDMSLQHIGEGHHRVHENDLNAYFEAENFSDYDKGQFMEAIGPAGEDGTWDVESFKENQESIDVVLKDKAWRDKAGETQI